ncbi:uncharacterized protein N7446_008134 [Penicillium canescens]|uniref:Uncharacterized protein n=1 Tax=Penicillium canescens TaxID=5083 RepID=A0AAD6NFB1_PENCN|nr:uncharacterized protein N7446_008134 [Penicillium canescens]KAJ6057235.1 hypothetical protein N7460_000509 [Penicillium canescens]KAJ6058551.1 hypothetical protein N7446_008134 [Penicillium canescens]
MNHADQIPPVPTPGGNPRAIRTYLESLIRDALGAGTQLSWDSTPRTIHELASRTMTFSISVTHKTPKIAVGEVSLYHHLHEEQHENVLGLAASTLIQQGCACIIALKLSIHEDLSGWEGADPSVLSDRSCPETEYVALRAKVNLAFNWVSAPYIENGR